MGWIILGLVALVVVVGLTVLLFRRKRALPYDMRVVGDASIAADGAQSMGRGPHNLGGG